MKRFGKIAIWSLCFATLTLSCTKVEQAESAQAQISYNVVQYTQTKAAGLYPTNVPFVSSAFYLEDGKTWAANHSEAIAYIENATISYDETRTSWHDAAHSYYWPRAGKLTFFSYSPQAIKGSTKIDRNSGITITNWDVNSHQDVDIMIADVQTDQTANQNVGTYTGVPTIFRHALSKISGFTFNLHKDYANGHSSGSYANGDVVFILKSIVIKNMPQKGTYSNTMPSESNIGSWDNASDRAGATMLINEEEVSFIEAENYWSTKNEHYWVANFKYTFFSYSPSSLKDKVDVSKDGVAIYNWDVEADATTEILVADIAKDKTKNESFSGYSGVPTNFRQKLSKLSFNMGISLDAEAGTKVTLLGIKIVGICTQGNYSKGGYTDNAWTVVEASRKKGTSVFTVFSGSKELSTESYFNPDSKLIIPQSLLQSGSYHPTLIVEYQIQVGEGAIETKTAECHFDINLRQESWVMGMEYTYTIHIGVGQYPIEFDGSVDAWNVVNNGEVNIG